MPAMKLTKLTLTEAIKESEKVVAANKAMMDAWAKNFGTSRENEKPVSDAQIKTAMRSK